MPSLFARLALAGSLLLLCGGAYAVANILVIDPMVRSAAQVSALREQLVELRRRRTESEAVLGQLLDTGSRDSGFRLAFISDDSAMSSNSMQEAVRGAAAAANATLISTQAGMKEAPTGAIRMQLLVRARFDEDGLLTFLRAIEEHSPVVFADSLDIAPAPSADGLPPLDVIMVLTAFHSNAL